MIYRCCDELRREAVRAHPTLNGIDLLEVIDHDLGAGNPLRQRTLLVTLLKPVPAGFSAANLRLSGGERIRDIGIQWAVVATAMPAPPDADAAEVTAIVDALTDPTRVLVVRTRNAGDFSPYTLRLASSLLDDALPPDIDPRLAEITFSFKVECPTDFDCRPDPGCPPSDQAQPDLDYLAKDYASLRRLVLDRLARLAPDWRQSSVADTGLALAELLAYAGDQLSYQQDAIATEAYLETARRRVSLRRHALLVDYPMHDGCNARAWVHLTVEGEVALPTSGTQFLTRCPDTPEIVLAPASAALQAALRQSPLIFEPLHALTLRQAHNEMRFHTWSDARCCLPLGATSATLAGHFPDLHRGDTLLFEEVIGPHTGQPGDADATHRHVVRLSTEPVPSIDPYDGQPVTTITWAAADALPFPLSLSTILESGGTSTPLDGITVARGNLVLVDHGCTLAPEALGSVPAPTLTRHDPCADRCTPASPAVVPVRYHPQLAHGPLTQAARVQLPDATAPFDPAAPAAAAFDWSMGDVLPQVEISDDLGEIWEPRRSLLASAADARDVVVEVDDDGIAALRFGDSHHGLRPATGTAFSAAYRIGNGAVGNISAGTIQHVVAGPALAAQVLAVRNPLPASGGTDPESPESVRRHAPQAFRTQERAVTTEDYATIAERQAGVQRAAATMRWTGSWYTAFVTLDPQDGYEAPALAADLAPVLDRYRMAGHDLAFDRPRYVSLEIDLHVCVLPDHFRSDVKAELLRVFSNRVLADGRRGLFHPDHFSFGQTVYLSPLYAAAHAVPGVASARITTFQRQGSDDPSFLASGRLPLGRLEIARLDNNANYPEHGVLRLTVQGGK